MKSASNQLIFLVAFVAIIGLASANQDDINAKFETFIMEAMEHFPEWVTSHDLDPTAVQESWDEFGFDLRGLEVYGHTFNRTYYGISKPIRQLSVVSDLRGKSGTAFFWIFLTFGSESDVHIGHYSIDGVKGNSTVPISGQGTFVEMDRRMDEHDEDPQFETYFINVFVDEDGYLRHESAASAYYESYFDTMIVENLDAGELQKEVYQLLKREIRSFTGGREVHNALEMYITEVLGGTPIEDIIGEPLPAQMRRPSLPHARNGKFGAATMKKKVTEIKQTSDGRESMQTKLFN